MENTGNPRRLFIIIVGVAAVLGLAALFVIPSKPKPGDPQNAAAVAVGAILYGEHCAECHGKNLEGEPNWRTPKEDGSLPAPPHDKSGHTWHHGDELLFRYTKGGGAAVVPEGFVSGMPAFEGVLKDEEIWDILAYIKSTWPEDIRQAQAER